MPSFFVPRKYSFGTCNLNTHLQIPEFRSRDDQNTLGSKLNNDFLKTKKYPSPSILFSKYFLYDFYENMKDKKHVLFHL